MTVGQRVVDGIVIQKSPSSDVDEISSWAETIQFVSADRPTQLLEITDTKDKDVRFGECLIAILDGEAAIKVEALDFPRRWITRDSDEPHTASLQTPCQR